MKTSTKIILGVGGVGVVFIFLLIAVFVIWILMPDAEYSKNYNAAQTEGREFGIKTDNNGCIKEGLSRAKGTAFSEIKNVTVKSIFVEECLKASRPVDNFCQSVPHPLAPGEMDWRIEQCKIAGLNDIETACLSVFDKKIYYCNHKK